MKAKAVLLSIMLIGMISLTGFGNTTPDPAQNSIVESVDDLQVAHDVQVEIKTIEVMFLHADYEKDQPTISRRQIPDLNENTVIPLNSSGPLRIEPRLFRQESKVQIVAIHGIQISSYYKSPLRNYSRTG